MRAAHHSQCAVGAKSQSRAKFRARVINDFLQTGYTPVLLLAHPGQAAVSGDVSSWLTSLVDTGAVPQSTVPTEDGACGCFDLYFLVSRRGIDLVFRCPAMAAWYDASAAVVRVKVIKQVEEITCGGKIGGRR